MRRIIPDYPCGNCMESETTCISCDQPICTDHQIDVGGSMEWGQYKCPVCAKRDLIRVVLVITVVLTIILWILRGF